MPDTLVNKVGDKTLDVVLVGCGMSKRVESSTKEERRDRVGVQLTQSELNLKVRKESSHIWSVGTFLFSNLEHK